MEPRVVAVGDSCLSLQLGSSIDPHLNARCIALAAAIEALRWPGIRDVVPAYSSVSVHFDVTRVSRAALGEAVRRLAMQMKEPDEEPKRTVEVPVKYGGENGPDLSAVAEYGRCSEDEVIRLHARTVYRVYMLGFLPGFAYMGAVDPRIAMPRLESPRLRVAAGSVGIAGSQTGIYPVESPGGWRIVGRTDVALCDFTRPQPFLFKAGDRVRFVAG